MSDCTAADPLNVNDQILLASVIGAALFFLLVDISKQTHCSDRNIFVRGHVDAPPNH